MIFLALLNNITLLVSLCFVQSLIMRRWKQGAMTGQVLSGLLFGVVALIGMLNPLTLREGIIFDGRSIVISTAGLFGGPVTASVTAVITAAWRIFAIGGAGTLMGVGVIAESALLGVAYHYLRRRRPDLVRIHHLWLFGFVVHLAMLVLTRALPSKVSFEIYTQIAIPVIVIYPLATVLVCLLILQQESRLKAISDLAESGNKLRRLTENIPGIVYQFYVRPDGKMGFHYVGENVYDVYGLEANLDTLLERFMEGIPAGDAERLLESIHQATRDLKHWDFEGRFTRPDGRDVHYRGLSTPVCLKDEVVFSGVILDITAQKRAEEEKAALESQLRQSQKMEAIGLLAGGVAHDLNNLLSPVLGYTDMMLTDPTLREDFRRDLEEILKAAERARDLVRQLMAFGRKQVLEVRALDMNEVVGNLSKLLRRMLREDIRLCFDYAPAACVVNADLGQIEQVIMNLSANAQDAMPRQGTLTIAVAAVGPDTDFAARFPGLPPGRYVLLSVTDTGVGMDAGTQARIFEPFFTTKEKGKGMGLGLASVYGIVKQHGGHIWVDSSPDCGTTFRICLPSADVKAEAPCDAATGMDMRGGAETILVAEDEAPVLQMACNMLRRLGYHVISANSVGECLQVAADHRGDIDLLLTDVVMPEMSGVELLCHLRRQRPDLKVLFMSGYTADHLESRGTPGNDGELILKPFTHQDLAGKVRQALDA
ncbi:MAG: response regulator [Acidobacteria bacterium]|nr:response regulator [Acidobacteriota bacterium]